MYEIMNKLQIKIRFNLSSITSNVLVIDTNTWSGYKFQYLLQKNHFCLRRSNSMKESYYQNILLCEKMGTSELLSDT
jgi:hypothetical protein